MNTPSPPNPKPKQSPTILTLATIPSFIDSHLSNRLNIHDLLSLKETCTTLEDDIKVTGTIHMCCHFCHELFVNSSELPIGVEIFGGECSNQMEVRCCIPAGKDWKKDNFTKWVEESFFFKKRGRRSPVCRIVSPFQRGTFYGYGAVDVRLHIPIGCHNCGNIMGQFLVGDHKNASTTTKKCSSLQFHPFNVIYVDHRGIECTPDGREMKSYRGTEYHWVLEDGIFSKYYCDPSNRMSQTRVKVASMFELFHSDT